MQGDSVQIKSSTERLKKGIHFDTCPPVQLITSSNSPISSSLDTYKSYLLYTKPSKALPVYKNQCLMKTASQTFFLPGEEFNLAVLLLQ